MTTRRVAPWLVLALVLAGCAMPIQAPPIRTQPNQSQEVLPVEKAPQAPFEALPVEQPTATAPAPVAMIYPKTREMWELDHWELVHPAPTVVAPVVPILTYPKTREMWELDHWELVHPPQ